MSKAIDLIINILMALSMATTMTFSMEFINIGWGQIMTLRFLKSWLIAIGLSIPSTLILSRVFGRMLAPKKGDLIESHV